MLHFRDRRDAALVRYRNGNRSEMTVLMCEYKPFPVWFSCRRKSYPVSMNIALIANFAVIWLYRRLLSYVQMDASAPKNVQPRMLGVVASVLAVVCKRMQQLTPNNVGSGSASCYARAWPQQCWWNCENGSNIVALRFSDRHRQRLKTKQKKTTPVNFKLYVTVPKCLNFSNLQWLYLVFRKRLPQQLPSALHSSITLLLPLNGAVSRNSAKLGNCKMPVKLRET